MLRPVGVAVSVAHAVHLPIADIKPSDILGVAVAVVAGSFVLWFVAAFLFTLLQPIYALLTGGEVSEDAMAIWFWIAVVAAIGGLLYWQFS